MAKNKVQFQQGFSLQELFSKYGTEQQCRQALIQWRWSQGFQCPSCGHDQYCELTTRHLFQCNRCHTQTSVTAGTIFDSTKLPLTTWFLAIYHITQSKISVSALSLKRIIGVSYNTALLMKHKIQQAMKERDDSKPLENIVQVDDAYWGGKKRDGKRGRGATGKIPFVAAVSTNSEGHPVSMRFSQVATFSKAEIHSWSKKHLSPGCKVISDGLHCFKAFEEAGFDHTAIITGGGPDSVELPELKWINTVISNVKRSIHGCFHAISEHHFSRYLAEYCYRFNRRFDLRQMMPRFCYIAVRTKPCPQRILKEA
jgi:transposase-like protein